MTKANVQKKDASFINRLNKIEVLKLIHESAEISRADIVKKTKLSAPTVTRIVDSLIQDKLVVMVGEGDSTGGRPPKLIKFDGSHNFVIGIDLGSTSIRGVVSNLEGGFLTEIETPTDLEGGFEKVSVQIAQLINKLIIRSKLEEDKIQGVGLAVPGLINNQSGIIEYSSAFDWHQVNLRGELKKHINIPIFCDNVSRVTALGELLYGVGKSHKNFICVNVGYGIGVGIIIDGSLFYGSKGFAGELGQIMLNPHSKYVGINGMRGCLEALSSGYGIAEIAKINIQEGAKSKVLDFAGGKIENITAKMVADAAFEDDPLAAQIFDEALKYLGIALDILIKLYNPEAIVLNGGLTRTGNIFFEKLKTYTYTNDPSTLGEEVKILPSSFKEDATLIGAFSLVISKVLQFESEW